MSHDEKPQRAEKTCQEVLLETMTSWADALSSLRHTLSSVREYLGMLNQREEAEEQDIKEIHRSVTATQTRLETLFMEVKTNCQTSLSNFLKHRGPVGAIKWLIQETHERPKAVITLYVLMATTAILLAALGLDVSQILKSLLVAAGITP